MLVRRAMLAAELGVPIEGPHHDDIFWIERLAEDGARYGITGKPFEPTAGSTTATPSRSAS